MSKKFLCKKQLGIFIIIISLFFILPSHVQASEVNWNFINWNNLDYGIYWYGLGNKPSKFIDGQPNPYFDPSKPTIIYIHGWQPEYTLLKHRESFYFYNEDAADAWIKAGWNVGVFYWNQFSDEINVLDAEAKIWTPNGPTGMRWRKADGLYSTENSPNESASQLLYDEYVKAMKGYKGSEIRIAGHSLGSQMAIALTKKLSDNVDLGVISPELLPKRVALLDPYFSNLGKYYLNFKWTGEVARSYVKTLIDEKNIPFELYKSSELTTGIAGDDNLELQKMCATSYMQPLFDYDIQQIEKHYAAKYTYFSSFASKPPLEYYNGSLTNSIAASASTPDLRIAQMMGPLYYWKQNAGQYTEATNDDAYQKYYRSGDYIPVSALNISCDTNTIMVGDLAYMKTILSPVNATNKMVAWTSSDENIARVSVNGVVEGLRPGKVIITATSADSSIKKSYCFTVESNFSVSK